jgi:hypothetical protein
VHPAVDRSTRNPVACDASGVVSRLLGKGCNACDAGARETGRDGEQEESEESEAEKT